MHSTTARPTARPTVAQVIAELDATTQSRLLAVREDGGFYSLPSADSIEDWHDAREYIKVVDVLDSPLQGWRTGLVTWTHALLIEAIDQPNEPFAVFVGIDEDDEPIERFCCASCERQS